MTDKPIRVRSQEPACIHGDLTWFVARRMEWIDEASAIFGYINRDHICRKFGVSVPQASHDIRLFMHLFPNALAYDRRSKRYNRVEARD